MQARWKTTTGCVIAALLAAVLFFTFHGKPNSPQATLSNSQPKPSVPKPARGTAVPATSAGNATRKLEIQICGKDGLPHTITDPTEVDPDLYDMKVETYDQWKSTLIGGSDARGHAVGLVLQRNDEIFAGSLAADTYLEQLVELAATAHDPVVYGVAVGVCKTGTTDDVAPACRRLSVSEWTQLDPDNALPWIASAASARSNGDSWAESVAFARAARAQRVDDYGRSSLSAALAALPADTPRSERLAGQIRLFGYDAARVRPDLSEISRYCAAVALQQSQVRDQCDAVAELLVDRGETLLTFGMGVSIGKRVGWPATKLQQMREEWRTLQTLLISNAGQNMLSCGFLARQDEFLERRAQVGELAALRELRDKQSSQ